MSSTPRPRRPPPLQAPPSTPKAGLPVASPLPSTIPSPFSSPSSSQSLSVCPLLKERCASRRRAFLDEEPRCSELTGGTVAGCVAVLCCCPFCVMDFVVLTTLRVPAGLCWKAVCRKRRRKKIAAPATAGRDEAEEEGEFVTVSYSAGKAAAVEEVMAEVRLPPSEEMERMDEEMWEIFNATGFFRSLSRKDGDLTDR